MSSDDGHILQKRREGRGRLSSIDMLPDEAEPDVIWAIEQLRERSLPQTAILKEFNARLADRGIGSIAKSSWSRYAVRKAIAFRQLDDVHRLSDDVISSLGSGGADKVTMFVGELLKLQMLQLLEGDQQTAKGVSDISRALAQTVTAQRGSTEHRRQLEAISDKIDKAAGRAETIARDAGLSADRIAQMRREFLGVKPKMQDVSAAGPA